MPRLEYKEIELTPKQKAYNTYRYVCAELADGLNLMMSPTMYNETMEGAGFEPRVEPGSVSFRKFANDFYNEYLLHEIQEGSTS